MEFPKGSRIRRLHVAFLSLLWVVTLPCLAAEGEKYPTLEKIIAGKISLYVGPDSNRKKLVEELAKLDFTGAVTVLLEGATKTKLPSAAAELITFCADLRDLRSEDDVEAKSLTLDLARTRALWQKILDDERDAGYLIYAEVPYRVSDSAAEILEALAIDYDDDEALDKIWEMWPKLGGHSVKWFNKRARARLAGEELPPIPDAKTIDPKSRSELEAEFLQLDETKRAGWLIDRSPDEILALRAMVTGGSADAPLAKNLLDQANAIYSSTRRNKKGLVVPPEWKPKSDSLDRGLIEEAVKRASDRAVAGEIYGLTINRNAGFGGVEIDEFPLDPKLLPLSDEIEYDPWIATIITALPNFSKECAGIVVARLTFNSIDDYVEEHAIWYAGIKPDNPDPIQLTEVLREAADEQQEFLDLLAEALRDPKKSGSECYLEFFCLPTAGK